MARTPIVIPAEKEALSFETLIRGYSALLKTAYAMRDTVNRHISDLCGSRTRDNKFTWSNRHFFAVHHVEVNQHSAYTVPRTGFRVPLR